MNTIGLDASRLVGSAERSGIMSEDIPALRRTLTLPWLVFYGLGVTVGAGIFALVGEIVALAGDAAPLSFLIAGIVAAVTGLSYAALVGVLPLAAGEAVFVTRGLGRFFGWLTGIAVAMTGIISSAAISLAFAGYVGTLVGVPEYVLAAAVVILLAFVAWWGVRESIALAALITSLEVGTLLIVIAFGFPSLSNLPPPGAILGLTGEATVVPILSGAVIAFFAFIGFEDIENMAEETVAPSRTAPRAILWTLSLTVLIYFMIALVAISITDRAELASSPAPMSFLFELITGYEGWPIAVIAAVAMINGILVQIVMSARVLYGMANEGLIPEWFAGIDARHHTPARSTFLIAMAILVLAALLPLVRLAELTSLVILVVFTLVNLSLFTLGRMGIHSKLRRWRYWGLFGAALCVAILVFQLSAELAVEH